MQTSKFPTKPNNTKKDKDNIDHEYTLENTFFNVELFSNFIELIADSVEFDFDSSPFIIEFMFIFFN